MKVYDYILNVVSLIIINKIDFYVLGNETTRHYS